MQCNNDVISQSNQPMAIFWSKRDYTLSSKFLSCQCWHLQTVDYLLNLIKALNSGTSNKKWPLESVSVQTMSFLYSHWITGSVEVEWSIVDLLSHLLMEVQICVACVWFFLQTRNLTSSLKLVLYNTRDIWKPETADYKQQQRKIHELKKHYIFTETRKSKRGKKRGEILCLLKEK